MMKRQEFINNPHDSLSDQPDNPVIKPISDAAINERNEISKQICLICLENLKIVPLMTEQYSNVLIKNKSEIRQFDKFFANFQDSIVLIGPEEATFQDLSPTPMDRETVPKVSVHGNALSSENIYKKDFR